MGWVRYGRSLHDIELDYSRLSELNSMVVDDWTLTWEPTKLRI